MMRGFSISMEPLEPIVAAYHASEAGTGAVVTFEGRVRDHHEGRRVLGLDYSSYEALARKEGTRIVEEAGRRFPLLAVTAIHRVGSLSLGEMAVWIRVEAGHRQEAFAAASWILDEIKSRVPVWKYEHYADGASQWVACHHESQEDHGKPV